jgi:hypothetical protein
MQVNTQEIILQIITLLRTLQSKKPYMI